MASVARQALHVRTTRTMVSTTTVHSCTCDSTNCHEHGSPLGDKFERYPPKLKLSRPTSARHIPLSVRTVLPDVQCVLSVLYNDCPFGLTPLLTLRSGYRNVHGNHNNAGSGVKMVSPGLGDERPCQVSLTSLAVNSE